LPSSGDEYQALRRGVGVRPLGEGWSDGFHALISSMMREAPGERPSAKRLMREGLLSGDGGGGSA
jgi:hypothetical protein